jgi:photosystem II stability/assembly factor-like uncharacterized protein
MNASRALMHLIVGLMGVLPVSAAHALAPTQVMRGQQHQALYAVSFDGDLGLAVGAGGEILATEDAGQSWAPQPSPTRLALLGVVLKGDVAIAVGQMGTILLRRGNGEWTQVETDTRERLFAVDLNADGVAMVVGGFGTLLRSTDGGAQWTSAAPVWEGMFNDPVERLGFFEPTLYDVQLDDDGTAYVAGEVSLVLRSSDAGASFEVVSAGGSSEEGVDPTLFAIDVAADGRGYAVGQEGTLLRTEDDGLSWQALPAPTDANLLSVSRAANGATVISGLRNVMIQAAGTSDWTALKGADIATGWYGGAVWLPGAPGPLAVGQFGSILQFE